MSSCIILIDYIQKNKFNRNKSIFSVIEELPNYAKIDDCLKSFFIENTNVSHNNFQIFSLNSLMNIYEMIELLCWDEFINNINDQNKMPINEEMKIKIKICIITTIKEENLIKKQDIANATRNLISRYLCRKREDTDISEFKQLSLYLYRKDLWKSDAADKEKFDEELYQIFGKINKIKFVIKC